MVQYYSTGTGSISDIGTGVVSQQMGLEGGGGGCGSVRTYSGRTVCTVRIYNTYLYATLSDQ